MSNYTYLVASLPMIFLGDPPPFSSEDFRFRCSGMLDARDLSLLDRVLNAETSETDPGFAGAWHNRETQLRNAVAAARAAHQGIDGRPFQKPHRGYSVAVAEVVTHAFSKATPLDREMELDRGRWSTAEELSRNEPFGLGAVLAFAVKLRIAERWAALNDEAGAKRLEDLVAANAEKSGP